MSVELRPLGVLCNMACLYCYQNKQRDAGHRSHLYDIASIQKAIEQIGGGFHMFGGEPLMLPKKDLEALWKWGFERFGSNGLQTNGILLDDDHIGMIQRYSVVVGISIDGPGPLNDARWVGTIERTREATRKTESAIARLCEFGLIPRIHIQLTRCNASEKRLPFLVDWLRHLDKVGILQARLHILEVEHPAVRANYALSVEQNVTAFSRIAQIEEELVRLRFDVFREIENNLTLRDVDSSCVWRACDPYTNQAVTGVGGHGERHNCGLTDKEGIDFQKPEEQGFERYIALYHTPWEHGGCHGCQFFLSCKGQCPGTAIDGDWRNRTENCEVWKSLHALFEGRLIAEGHTPLSLHPRRLEIEQRMLEHWSIGKNPPIQMVAE